jgi:hypothetical protein
MTGNLASCNNKWKSVKCLGDLDPHPEIESSNTYMKLSALSDKDQPTPFLEKYLNRQMLLDKLDCDSKKLR